MITGISYYSSRPTNMVLVTTDRPRHNPPTGDVVTRTHLGVSMLSVFRLCHVVNKHTMTSTGRVFTYANGWDFARDHAHNQPIYLSIPKVQS